MERDLVASHASVRGNYKHPIVSDSMAFSADPASLAEHRAKFPDVDLHISEGTAQPVLRSLSQKRRYLKESGWVDRRSFS